MGAVSSVEGKYQVQQIVSHHVEKTGFIHFDVETQEGTFGKVSRCVNKTTGEVRAVKRIAKTTPERRKLVMSELEIIKQVAGQHDNIVHFFECFDMFSRWDLVFEWCDEGNLEDLSTAGFVTTAGAARFCYGLLNALVFLKNHGILHRDVKPANVLLHRGETRRPLVSRYRDDASLTCKLGDFGSSCKHQASKPLFEAEGTPGYFSPEVLILPKGYGYSFPMDAWGLGVTLYMMLFQGQHPFKTGSNVLASRVIDADYKVGWMNVYNPKAASLIGWFLLPSPQQRIIVEDAIKHCWLGSFGHGKGEITTPPPSSRIVFVNGQWALQTPTCKVF